MAAAVAPPDELLLLLLLLALLDPPEAELEVAAGPAAAAVAAATTAADADDECFVFPDDWGLVLLLFDGEGEDDDGEDVSVVGMVGAWSAPALSGAFGWPPSSGDGAILESVKRRKIISGKTELLFRLHLL